MMHEVQNILLWEIQIGFSGFLGRMTPERAIKSCCTLRAGFLVGVLPICIPATPVTQRLSSQVTLPIQSPLFTSCLNTSPSFCFNALVVTQVVAVLLLVSVPKFLKVMNTFEEVTNFRGNHTGRCIQPLFNKYIFSDP